MSIAIVTVMPSYTYRDGRMVEIPDTVLTEDSEVTHPISNTLVIRPGVTATTLANVSGTVHIMSGSTLVARGAVSGTVNVEAGARFIVHKAVNGTVNIDRAGVVHLMAGAAALGAMHVEGTLINEGTRGVNVSGGGRIEDREGSRVRRPDRTLSDGTTIYEG